MKKLSVNLKFGKLAPMQIFVMSAAIIPAMVPAVSMAHPCDLGDRGVYVMSTLVSRSLTYTSDPCKLSEPLSLSRTTYSYPLLGQLEVDYWKGSYSRSAQIKSVYQESFFTCRDGYLGSTTRESVELESVPFAVDNPNLHDDVAASYIANAPMTDSEARVALETARDACQNASAR